MQRKKGDNMKKPKILCLLAVLALSFTCGCTEAVKKDASEKAKDIAQEISDQAQNIADSEDEHVISVKNGHPELYPEITYGDAFDAFFGTPTWKYFEADSGEDVVEFTGYCTYQDTEVKARLQFILQEDGTFTSGAMSFNDVPQSQLITAAMLEAAFDQYAEDNGISTDGTTDNNSTADKQAAESPASDKPAAESPASDNQAAQASANENKTAQNPASKNPSSQTEAEAALDMSALEGDYKRTSAPTCYLSVWSAGNSGINFSLGIGSSGYRALVDIRDCQAAWTDSRTAVYSEGDILIQISVGNDGALTVSEDKQHRYNEEFPLDGTFVRNEDADENCEFIFPQSDITSITPSALEGKNAIECRIARNEIYARHGRKFNDEGLQGYFETCTWYDGYIEADNFSEDILNETERSNLQIISEYEANMGF